MEAVFDPPDYKFDWKNTAFHYDDTIVKKLVIEIIRLAVVDWYYMKDKTELQSYSQTTLEYSSSLEGFFKGWFLGMIMDAMFPEYDQETILRVISKRNYKPRELSERKKRIKIGSDINIRAADKKPNTHRKES